MAAATRTTGHGAASSAGAPDRAAEAAEVVAVRPTGPLVRAGIVGGAARACGVALTATSAWLIVAASFEPQLLVLLVAIVAVRAFGIARPVLRWWERVQAHDAALADLAGRRTAVWRLLVPLAPARLAATDRGLMLAGLVDDLDDVVGAQVRVVVPAVAMAVAGLVATVVAWLVLPLAGVVVLGTVVALAGVAWVDGLAEQRAQAAVVAARADVAAVTTLVAGRATELAACGAHGRIAARLAAAQEDLRAATSRQARGRAMGLGLVPLVVAIGTALQVVLARQAVAEGLATPVAALVVLVPLGLAEALGTDVADAPGWWVRARAAGTRLAGVLGREPAVTDAAAPTTLPADPATRELTGVTAAWDPDGPDVDLPDLAVPPGGAVALVGPNGAGKSTAVALLARHLDPLRGDHLVGSTDATVAALDDVRSRLAILDDEPHVFDSTLRNNLTLARPGADDEAVHAALGAAGLGSWVAALPDGLDTRLGATGRGMSGGQRTRLGLARCLLADRPVMVLDEPVAHLDHPLAVAVMADVHRSCGDRTLVVVQHRPEGLGSVDRVVHVGARH